MIRLAVLAAALVAAGVLVATGGEEPRAQESAPPRATAAVERLDLVDRETIAGTLSYADASTLTAGVSGTLTKLREPGTIVTRGHSLYAVDDKPAAFLLYGDLPAWRDFQPGMTDGEDVRQLERNLRALGHDPGTVDDDWDWETTAAVKRFQAARGLTEDGTLSRGEIVFRDGPVRIGEAKAAVGDQASPGRPLTEISSTERRVTVQLDARRQQLARRGDDVIVELPSGRTVNGRIEEVGKVATKQGDDVVVEVTITLEGRSGTLDQAPVDVAFAVERRKQVLAVPVKALLARQGGGYAVELTDGRLVTVEPGLYADDMVEIEGDISEGQQVVTAQ
ncbi:MAG TPA: peptidoglycan-binding protein [Solirubrobacter sp.]|nr:peptidoglycan-binding protein [Solirubrobacter sp.]